MGGISASIHLASRGFEVTIFEKNNSLGGRCNVIEEEGFKFDLGPSLLNYPDGQSMPTPSEIDFTPGHLLGSVSGGLGLENFLKENQNDRKVFIEGTGGCRSNPKDSFWLSQARLTKQEMSMLSV